MSPAWTTDWITRKAARSCAPMASPRRWELGGSKPRAVRRDGGLPALRLERTPPRSPSSAPPRARRITAARLRRTLRLFQVHLRNDRWPHNAFTNSTISAVRPQTAHAKAIRFELPDALKAEFAFKPGQYLTLRTKLNGEDVRRSYSICCAPGEGLEIGVKHVEGGAFSSPLHKGLNPATASRWPHLMAALPQNRVTTGTS
jgi:hypothetical protein